MSQERYTFTEFQEIIARLRAPGGCPWDREQTHESLKPCMVEETAELLAAIGESARTGDDSNLIEELGDVLLQVVMHAAIAEEEGRFTMDDVTTEISRKMIRRHPHVFGDVSVDSSREVLQNWEEIKRTEKSHGSPEENPVAKEQSVEDMVVLLNRMIERKGMQCEIVIRDKKR